jgi:hypothetical protein
MKVSLLLCGMLRRFDDLYPNLKEYILDEFQPDVFFSGYPNKKGLSFCENEIKKIWKPKDYFITNYDETFRKKICKDETKYFSNKRPETNVPNTLSYLWNIKNVNKLKKKYETENNFKYDVVIFSRTDLIYHGTPSLEDMLLAKSGKILIPKKWDFWEVHPEAMSNQFAISNSSGMDKYCSQFDCVDSYVNDGIIFHPETITGVHINRMNLKRVEIGIRNNGAKEECPWFDFDYERMK